MAKKLPKNRVKSLFLNFALFGLFFLAITCSKMCGGNSMGMLVSFQFPPCSNDFGSNNH